MLVFRDVTCLVMDPHISYESLLNDLRDIYKFAPRDKFTLKWIDDEGMHVSIYVGNKAS